MAYLKKITINWDCVEDRNDRNVSRSYQLAS